MPPPRLLLTGCPQISQTTVLPGVSEPQLAQYLIPVPAANPHFGHVISVSSKTSAQFLQNIYLLPPLYVYKPVHSTLSVLYSVFGVLSSRFRRIFLRAAAGAGGHLRHADDINSVIAAAAAVMQTCGFCILCLFWGSNGQVFVKTDKFSRI